MNLLSYEAYFESLASQKLIGHTPSKPRFGMVLPDEIESGLRTNLDMTNFCLLLQDYEGQFSVNKSGHGYQTKIGGVFLLKEVGKGDAQAEKKIKDEAEQLAKKLWAKIIFDFDTAFRTNDFSKFPLRFIDRTRMQYQFQSQLFDNAAGILMTFTTTERLSYTNLYNPTDWP